jgi:cyclic pyranopterin phosphate synthase
LIEIYTDGACLGNPGPGGWAAVILERGNRRTIKGREDHTTNNRMEILAVVEGLKDLDEPGKVTVFSDSQYLINTMTKNWNRKANLDLWEKLDSVVGDHEVTWRWVRGHDGDPMNEMADKLAVGEAKLNSDINPSTGKLTHLNTSGEATMVDISMKPDSVRIAVARAQISMNPQTLVLIEANDVQKGDVISVARIAGIMAAKNTSQLIPLCHPLPLTKIGLQFDMDHKNNLIAIEAIAKTTAKTGVEMEAMTAVSIAALTIYDMCKGVDRAMRITNVRLVKKTGGTSGDVVLE